MRGLPRARAVLASVMLAGCVAVVAGCHAAPADDPTGSSTVADAPPPLVVTGDDGALTLAIDSICWHRSDGGSCGDGVPREDPPSVGAPESVEIGFDIPGWTFQATFTQVTTQECALSLTVTATPIGDGLFSLDPVGPAGEWRVALFGSGPGGDVSATFAWTTPVAGPTDGASETGSADCENEGR